jgi:hypothetical protein
MRVGWLADHGGVAMRRGREGERERGREGERERGREGEREREGERGRRYRD